jgi:hypothetical protein
MNKASRVISDAYLHEQQRLHQNPRYGRASIGYAPLVASLLRLGRCGSLADYGAGKCNLKHSLDRIGAKAIDYRPYDPAFPDYGPPRAADLVTCIDVLEHVEPELLDGVLGDLARITRRLGFFTVHTGPAVKTLSDGRNAHIIQQPPSWWLPRFAERFEIVHLQTVPKGFWVLAAEKTDAAAIVASLDTAALARAAARNMPRRKGPIARLAKQAAIALGLKKPKR